MRNRWQEALPVQKRLTLLLPELPDERRDLGLIYLRTGHVYRAIQLLDHYMTQCDCDHAEMVAPYLVTARRMLAEMN
jgi:regulator of sirC expression with transglutaminase-like and TPR domain